MVERRAQLQALTRELGLPLGATGTHPWSRWQDQRIIDTPHYRRNDELLRYVVWRNNTFGLHVHVGIRGGDRAIAVCNAMRRFLPELLALSASSPFVEEVDTRAPLGAHADLHADVPALRDPGRLRRLAGVRGLRRVPLPHAARSPSTPSSGGASARTSPTRRSRSGSATPSPTSPRRRRSPRSPTRSPPAARGRIDEGEPLPDLPHRLLEENLWRAIRWGLPGELIDFDARRGRPRARAARGADRVGRARRRGDRRGALPRRARRRTRPSGSRRGGKMGRRWSRSMPSR